MRDDKNIIIIGGGLAGMSCGVYALRNGYRVTIIEHNLALGGVCTAWKRDAYTVDGCIHWLTGGPFMRVYEELDIVRQVGLRTLDTWTTYRDVSKGIEVPFTRDLSKFFGLLREIAPLDADELARIQQGAGDAVRMEPPLKAHELMTPRDGFHMAWAMRGSLSTLMHFRKPLGEWAREHLKSTTLQRVFLSLFPETTPALFLLMVLAPHLPAFAQNVRMRDIATPLTYWSKSRSWRGAYEGWMPSGASLMSSLDKKLPGLAGFYMAGQWVEPGGGVPTATLSGRQAAQLICADDQRPFVAT